VRTEKGHHRLRADLQVAPVRIGLGDVAEQHKLLTALFQMQRKVRDIGQARVVDADQAGEGVALHELHGLLGLAFELGRLVHS